MTKPYDGPWSLRTLLFVPGHIDKMLAKAPGTDADCVVLDLEDAVPIDEKANARVKIREVLESGLYARKTVFSRINPLESGLTLKDLEGVACEELHGFVYPMAYTADDIKNFDAQLRLIEAHKDLPRGHFSIIVLIETPLAALNAYELATASDRVVGLLYGCEDYLAEIEATYGANYETLHTPRSLVVMGARAAGVVPIDTPYVKVHDIEGLEVFAQQARDLGMDGMLVMTPKQIETAHRIYTPSAEAVEYARVVVEEAEKASKEGRGILVVDGKFISPPTLKAARKLLARHVAICKLQDFAGCDED